MANFGGLTDHFSLAGDDLVLISSSKTPVARSRADAQDENADIAAATWFGATDIYDIECTYALKSSTKNLNTLKLGELEAGTVASSIGVSTSNGEWPQITVSGREGLETITAPSTKANTWTLPSLTISGMKQAQPMGFTVSAGKLSSTSFDFACEIAEQTNGLGAPVAHGVSSATGSLSAEFVNTADTQPAWSLTLSGLTSTQEPSTTEGQAEYHTASATAEMILARDNAA
jgi:hypothetical protein